VGVPQTRFKDPRDPQWEVECFRQTGFGSSSHELDLPETVEWMESPEVDLRLFRTLPTLLPKVD